MNFRTNRKALNDLLDYIKKNIKIEDVASKLGLDLTDCTNKQTGNCPTGHPSQSETCFQVIKKKNFFYCHNCNVWGSAIDLVEVVKKLDFKESLQWIINNFDLQDKFDLSKLNIKPKTPEEKEAERKEEVRRLLLERIVEEGKKLLFEEKGKEVLDYLVNKRKFDQEKINETELFYLPGQQEAKAILFDEFPAWAEDIKELKLIGHFGDVFRLAWPYRNISGEITGFIKRSIKPEGESGADFNKKPFNKQRYDSTPGTDKSDLFGLYKIEKTDTVLIVEGYPDAISLPMHGYSNIAAIGQGCLSEKHLKGLEKKEVDNVIISFDKDNVGPENTEKAVKLLLSTKITPFVLEPTLLGNHKDPDEFVRAEGIQKFEELTKNVVRGMDWLIGRTLKKYDLTSPLDKQRAQNDLTELCLLIKNPLDEAALLKAMTDNFQMTKEKANAWIKNIKDENKENKSSVGASDEIKHEGKFWGALFPEGGDPIVKINTRKYLDFISEEGFAKHYLDKDYVFIRSKNNVVKEHSLVQIKDYILESIKSLDENLTPEKSDLLEKILDEQRYFSEGLIECIPPKKITFKKDERRKAFCYYKNGFVVLEKGEKMKLLGYEQLDMPIWQDSIIQREIKLADDKSRKSEFEQFLFNAMGKSNDRFLSVCSAIGYMLHDYKDMSNAKAVILCDEALTGSDEPSGRTGKSLIGKALSFIKNAVQIDSRNFEFKNQFSFQAVKLDTRILDFNDAQKEFKFDKLFSIITNHMTVEYKNKASFTIPFDESPKLLISTNYTIQGIGSSYRDRMFEVEFSSHYSDTHKPEHEFGHLFFDGWDEEEWMRFDYFMIECLQLYLDEGLIYCQHINLARRKLIDMTSSDFANFAEGGAIQINTEYNLTDLFRSFKTFIGFADDWLDKCPIKQNSFSPWLPIYARFKGWEFTKRQSNGKQLVKFTS